MCTILYLFCFSTKHQERTKQILRVWREGEDNFEIPNLVKKISLRQERSSGVNMLKRIQ